MSTKKYLPLIQNLYKSYQKMNNYMQPSGQCRVLEATEGRVKVELDVTEALLNPVGTMHGGCTATLFDVVTTTALVATPRGLPGVSVDLNVSYISAAKLGETVIIDAEVVRAGRTLAFTKANMYRKTDQAPIATALHTKAIIEPKKTS